MKDPAYNIIPQFNDGSPEYEARLRELQRELLVFRKTINLSIEVITPEWCLKFLGENRHNRRIRWPEINLICKEILEGRFKLNGQPFIIGKSKASLDAQHRALAVIQAGLPIISVVVDGIPDETRSTIDTGSARTASDELQLSGMDNAVRLASAAKNCLIALRREKNFKDKFPNETVRNFVIQHPGLQLEVTKSKSFYRPYPSSGYIAALSFLFKAKDKEVNEVFWNKLKTGVGLTEGNPIYALRRFCEELAYGKKYDWSGPLFCFTILAWNALREGRKIKDFRNSIYDKLDSIPEIL